jgi:hypothetical protein
VADFSNMLSGFGGVSVTRHRRAVGSNSYGLHTPGRVTQSTITAVWIHGLETQELLPHGERTGEIVTLYTSAELFTTRAPDGYLADLVEDPVSGELYEVRGVRNLSAHGNFREAAAVRVTQ